ncbi:MFS transporter [Bacillus ndiopicus]|uniref:MFS transporter n=1 Tax=Bacillus ndiopicus TaxID=1347368 RepID=UPI0005A89F6C|nr:MFS transporter [Bacillus ndiopicus]
MDSNIMEKKARNTVLLLLFLGWTLGNLDRYIMNYAIVDIGKDLSLSATETGLILSSFFLGYAIMQMPGGLLADRFGAKKVLLTAVIVWSIFTGLTAIAWSLAAMVVIRFLFGIGEGGFQPSASKIISNVFPKDERSKAMSLMLSSGAIMAMLVPIISAVLLTSIGWRMFFVIAGVSGTIIAFLYWRYINIPNEKTTNDLKSTGASKGFLKSLLTMPFMWSLLISYFTIYAVNWGLNSWLPTYLTQVRNLDLMSIGYLQLIPGFLMLIAMFTYGFIIDRLSLGKNKIIGAICAFGVAISLFLMFNATSIAMFITYQCIVTLLMTYVTLLLPSFILKNIPQHITGTAMGMANTGGQLAGFVTPTLIGFMIDAFDGSYNAAFWLLIALAGVCILSILLVSTKEQSVDKQGVA